MAKMKDTRSGSTISKRSAVKASSKSAKSVASSALSQKRAGGFVLGRKAFSSISAVEGVYLSRDMRADFRRLESVSPAARRGTLSGKYGKKQPLVMYDAEQDTYCYVGTTILKNKAGLLDQDDLNDFETAMTFARAEEPLPAGRLSVAHYCRIHHHLFQDVYR